VVVGRPYWSTLGEARPYLSTLAGDEVGRPYLSTAGEDDDVVVGLPYLSTAGEDDTVVVGRPYLSTAGERPYLSTAGEVVVVGLPYLSTLAARPYLSIDGEADRPAEDVTAALLRAYLPERLELPLAALPWALSARRCALGARLTRPLAGR
jgi:hypothetical protein